ncbi:hypothetical protein EAF00_003918 [Botryotinia globosa]|nr:hypothetical protein EAF00_003918 [Botryotinia globosa]
MNPWSSHFILTSSPNKAMSSYLPSAFKRLPPAVKSRGSRKISYQLGALGHWCLKGVDRAGLYVSGCTFVPPPQNNRLLRHTSSRRRFFE